MCCSSWCCKELDTTESLNLNLNLNVGFPGGTSGNHLHVYSGDPVSILGSGRSPGVENGNPLQYSCLEISMDREPGGL